MQRRSFLKSLMAVAGGLTVAGRAVASTAASPTNAIAKPTGVSESLAITADTTQFERSLDESQRMIVEMLKECRVTQWSRETIVSGADTWTITYRHAPWASRTSLDDEADEVSRGRVPRSVNVSAIASSCDISDPDEFGHYSLVPNFDRGDYEIEVEWI